MPEKLFNCHSSLKTIGWKRASPLFESHPVVESVSCLIVSNREHCYGNFSVFIGTDLSNSCTHRMISSLLVFDILPPIHQWTRTMAVNRNCTTQIVVLLTSTQCFRHKVFPPLYYGNEIQNGRGDKMHPRPFWFTLIYPSWQRGKNISEQTPQPSRPSRHPRQPS